MWLAIPLVLTASTIWLLEIFCATLGSLFGQVCCCSAVWCRAGDVTFLLSESPAAPVAGDSVHPSCSWFLQPFTATHGPWSPLLWLPDSKCHQKHLNSWALPGCHTTPEGLLTCCENFLLCKRPLPKSKNFSLIPMPFLRLYTSAEASSLAGASMAAQDSWAVGADPAPALSSWTGETQQEGGMIPGS